MALVLALGITGAVIAWGYLVYLAIMHGQAIRSGDNDAWLPGAASGLGAVACLFLGFILVAQLLRTLATSPSTHSSSSPAIGGGHRVGDHQSGEDKRQTRTHPARMRPERKRPERMRPAIAHSGETPSQENDPTRNELPRNELGFDEAEGAGPSPDGPAPSLPRFPPAGVESADGSL